MMQTYRNHVPPLQTAGTGWELVLLGVPRCPLSHRKPPTSLQGATLEWGHMAGTCRTDILPACNGRFFGLEQKAGFFKPYKKSEIILYCGIAESFLV